MTLPEALDNWSSIPWINTDKYTTLEIGLFFAGCIFWLVAYIYTLIWIRKKQTVAIPIVAVILNYGWEISVSFFFLPDMGKLLIIAYWAWMFLDTFIFASLFTHGKTQVTNPYFRKNLHWYLLSGIALSIFAMAQYMVQYDLPMAPITAYIGNVVMSVIFIFLLFVPSFEGNSRVVGWTKFLGTGIISIMWLIHYPQNYFLMSMYISCALFDIIYLVLLEKKLNGKLS